MRIARSKLKSFRNIPKNTMLFLRRAPASVRSLLPLVRAAPSQCARCFAAPPRAKAPRGDPEGGSSSSSAQAASTPSSSRDVSGELKSAVESFKRELSKIRGSTASPGMLDHVMVVGYGGEKVRLDTLGTISLRSPTLLVVAPFDSALAHAIADGLRGADLNLNPSVEGNAVRVPLPKPSKESREAAAKLVSKLAEAAKTRVRRVRQAGMDALKKGDTGGGGARVSDEGARAMKELQAAVDAATAEITKLAEKRRVEVEGGKD